MAVSHRTHAEWSLVCGEGEVLSRKLEAARRGQREEGNGGRATARALGDDDFLFLQLHLVPEPRVTPSHTHTTQG